MGKLSEARTTRQDPAQESLIQKKDRINERTSKIIELLIDTKRSWNGKPAPGIGVNEPSSIKEPLPIETTRSMDEIVQMVQQLNLELDQVAAEQANYQKTRKQPQQIYNQNNQTKSNSSSLDLSSIASSSVSRFITNIKTPFMFGDSNKWARLKLLKAASNIDKHLKEIQEFVLSTEDTDLPNAIYKAKDLFYIFDNDLVSPILTAVSELPKKSVKNKEPVNADIPLENEHTFLDLDKDIFKMKGELMEEMQSVRNNLSRDQISNLSPVYNDLFRRISNLSSFIKSNPEKADEEYTKIEYDIRAFIENARELSKGFETTANRFTTWLKRKNQEYFIPKDDHIRSLRLSTDKIIQIAINNINHLMDALETSDVSLSSLTPYLKNAAESLADAYRILFKLGDMYNSKVKVMKHEYREDNERVPIIDITMSDLRSLNRFSQYLDNTVDKISSLEEKHV